MTKKPDPQDAPPAFLPRKYVQDISNYGVGCCCLWQKGDPDETPPTSECFYHGTQRETTLARLRELCVEIEKLPASEQQTKVSGMASDLAFKIQQQRVWK